MESDKRGRQTGGESRIFMTNKAEFGGVAGICRKVGLLTPKPEWNLATQSWAALGSTREAPGGAGRSGAGAALWAG